MFLGAAIHAAAFGVMRGRITDDGVKRVGKDATSFRISAAADCALLGLRQLVASFRYPTPARARSLPWQRRNVAAR